MRVSFLSFHIATHHDRYLFLLIDQLFSDIRNYFLVFLDIVIMIMIHVLGCSVYFS